MHCGDLHDGRATRTENTAVQKVRAALRMILATILVGGGLVAMGTPRASAGPASFGPDWVVESTIPLATVHDIAFTSEMDGWAVGDADSIAVTHDGGKTWGIQSVTAPYELQRILFTDPLHGYAAGQEEFLLTQDGGSTWQATPSAPAIGIGDSQITSIAAPTLSTFFVTGADGTIQASGDMGASWQYIIKLVYTAPCATWVVFTSPANGWIVRCDLWHSTDGGDTWTQATSQGSFRGPLDFVDPTTGFVGWNGGLARTTDGGSTWTPIGDTFPSNAFLYRFLSAQTGIGSDGVRCYITMDGGSTWQQKMVADHNCVVIGFRGTLPFAADSDGTFLHYGPLPAAATATATSTEAATAVPSATTSATATPGTVAPLTLTGISPTIVVVRSQTTLTFTGTGFDDLATVTIGDDDLTDVVVTGTTTLAVGLPTDLGPGTYDVSVTEPDNRSATLPHALKVVPRLTLSGHLLHALVKQGATGVILLHAIAGAQLRIQVTTANGHAAPHILVKAQAGTHGQWRLVLTIGAHVAPGVYRVVVTAQMGQQHVQLALIVRVVPR